MGTRDFCEGLVDGGLRVSAMAAAHLRDTGTAHSRASALGDKSTVRSEKGVTLGSQVFCGCA